jgi:hypothetical protein
MDPVLFDLAVRLAFTFLVGFSFTIGAAAAVGTIYWVYAGWCAVRDKRDEVFGSFSPRAQHPPTR